MKRWLLLVPLLVMPGCVSDQITALSGMMISIFVEMTLVSAILVAIIFALNYLIKDKEGNTNNQLCAIVGVVIMPIFFLLFFNYHWGLNWITIPLALLIGGGIGWFSYMLDELLAECWEERRVTLPGLLGLVWGGTFTVFLFTAVWLQGNMFVTHTACCNRVVIERFDVSYTTDDDGNSERNESWDYLYHVQKIAYGRSLPILTEGKEYDLGYGDEGVRDRTRFESYYFIGGRFWSEKHERWQPFRWLLLQDPNLNFNMNEIQVVNSNYFGHPISNGGVGRAPQTSPEPEANPALPREDELPSPTVVTRAIGFTASMVYLMFAEEEYRSLLYFFLVLYGTLVLIALFVPVAREGIGVFIICNCIIVLILILAAAAKTGSGLSSRRRSGGAALGGRSYGGGARRRF